MHNLVCTFYEKNRSRLKFIRIGVFVRHFRKQFNILAWYPHTKNNFLSMKKHFDISIQFLARKFKLARKRAYQVNFFSSLIRTVNVNENSLKTCKTFFYCMMLLWRKFINHRKNADIIDASSRFQRCVASVLTTRKPPQLSSAFLLQK